MLPLMLGCTAAYAVTSLIMPRSILTEKPGRPATISPASTEPTR